MQQVNFLCDLCLYQINYVETEKSCRDTLINYSAETRVSIANFIFWLLYLLILLSNSFSLHHVRFHSLSEFDEKKRSCRRRLSDHNARRRKPRQETIQFHSAKLTSSFYGIKIF